MSITLKELNEFAERAGVSQDAVIYPLGADVVFMAAYRDKWNGYTSEEIILDEEVLGYMDLRGDTINNREILLVWDEKKGEQPDFSCCNNCVHCKPDRTRNPDTGYCCYYKEEVDLDDENCEKFGRK